METKLVRMTTVPFSMRALLKGQEVYFSEKAFTLYLGSGPGERTTQSGMRIEYLPLSRELSVWQDIYALWKTWRWLKAVRPDILHTHTPKAGLIGMIAGFFAGVPLRLHTVAGLPEMEMKGPLKVVLRLTEQITATFATHVYPNSYGLMHYMAGQRLAPSRKMKVIGNGSSNGIDVEYYKHSPALCAKASYIRHMYGIDGSDRVFVFVGRLDNHKGMRELQVAFEQILKTHERTWLLLVGPVETVRGGLDPGVLHWYQSNDHVVLAGMQQDIRPWLLAGDVLVFPSYREGFPNAPLQAMALGRPVIATDIIGCNEIVKHGVNGLLIPKKDPDALTSAMRYFLKNRQQGLEMGKCGRESVVQKFEQQWYWSQLEKEYAHLLQTKAG